MSAEEAIAVVRRNTKDGNSRIVLEAPAGTEMFDAVNILNLGTNEYCRVGDSIGWICDWLGLKPELTYEGGKRGWTGDSPFILLDCSKIRALGWQPRFSIQQGVITTLKYLQENRWLLVSR